MTQVLPVEEHHLAEVGRFLHENLNRRFSPESWSGSLTHRWAASQPNYGMQLREGGRLVGVFCAIYSDQVIDGKLERFCNPHSWCVLDSHRNSGIGLVLQLLRQPGYHFTMYTPNPKVAEIFRGLRFRELDPGLTYFPNFPSPFGGRESSFVEDDPVRIEKRLRGYVLDDFRKHRGISWLRFVAFGTEADPCLAVYKKGRWKQLPCAMLIHLSDRAAFGRHAGLLQAHLLGRGLPVSRIETRFVDAVPRAAYKAQRSQPKLVMSRSLRDDQFVDLYSELAALDV